MKQNFLMQYSYIFNFLKENTILTPTVVKDSILATGLMKVYHHGFDS